MLGAALGLGTGCSGDQLNPGHRVAADSLYWRLELNHHAVTLSLLAPYDTLTVTATPRNVRDEPLEGLGTPEYNSPNLEQVRVMPGGVLRAVGLTPDGQPIPVVATLMAGNLKHVDTVLVRVVADTLPKLASLSIHPTPPDSAKSAAGVFPPRPLPMVVVDSTGASISDALVAVRSSDIEVASVLNFFGVRRVFANSGAVGQVNLIASTTIFGITRADTLPYRIGLPVSSTRILTQRGVLVPGGDSVSFFQPPEVRVGVGAAVWWQRKIASDTASVDVTFADGDLPNIVPLDSTFFMFALRASTFGSSLTDQWLALCQNSGIDCNGAGNVEFVAGSQGAARVFTKPGTYEYRSTRYGTTGRIVVVDERP